MKLLNRRYSRPSGPRPKPQRDHLLRLLVESFPRSVEKGYLARKLYGSTGWYEVKRVNSLVWLLRKEPDVEIETTNPKQAGLGTVKLVRLTPKLRKLRAPRGTGTAPVSVQASVLTVAQRPGTRLSSMFNDYPVPVQQTGECAQASAQPHESATPRARRSSAQGAGNLQQELRSRPPEGRDGGDVTVRRGRTSTVRLANYPGGLRAG